MFDFDELVHVELNDDERNTLICMLAELSCIDGNFDKFERDFVVAIIGDDMSELVEQMKKIHRPAREEIGKIRADNRASVYLICSLLAYIDERLKEPEKERLGFYAEALGLNESAKEELDSLARVKVLEQGLIGMDEQGATRDDKLVALESLAQMIGATRNEIAQALGD